MENAEEKGGFRKRFQKFRFKKRNLFVDGRKSIVIKAHLFGNADTVFRFAVLVQTIAENYGKVVMTKYLYFIFTI